MKKSKLLKTISFSSLALLMGIAGTMAFAPLGASPSVASSNEMVDQVNTKADGENIKYAPSALGLDPENDPVIYTTESGLEIKFGGESVSDKVASGKPLTGYPYFTMGTYNGYAVNWVIIGRNTNDTVFTSAITYHLFSSWKTNNGSLSSATFKNNGYSFFKNTFETTTPAGSAINGVVPSKSYVADVTKATKSVVANAEVPSGCVLAISEGCLGYSFFNTTSAPSNTYLATASNTYGSRYRYLSASAVGSASSWTPATTTDGTLYTYINNLYSTNLGLTSAQKNLIQGQKLNTIYETSRTKAYLDTYETDGNTLYKLFPLAGFWQSYDVSNYTGNNPGNENFLISTYLTTNALRKAYQIGETTSIFYWLRSAEPSTVASVASIGKNNTSADGCIDGYGGTNNFGVRPAGVFKLG